MSTAEVVRGCPFSNPSRLFEDFAQLREKHELEYSEVLKAHVVTRYEDIIHVLDHPEIFSSRVTIPEIPPFLLKTFEGKVPTRGTLLGWDNPDHDRLRMCVSSFFVPRRLARFEPLIRKLANELIDEFVTTGSADLKHQFALPLPLKVVCTVVGIDVHRWEWVGRSLALFGGHAAFSAGTFEEKLEGIMDIHAHIADLIQQRKDDRRDDLISHIWNERDAGRVQMTDFEHLAMIPGLMLAGHETTTNLLSMGMAHLLNRGIWEVASQDDQTISATIEELLRFESAITGMKREVLQPTTIGSTTLKHGDVIFVAYNSGSRDPSRFSDADNIVIGRKTSTQHLGFGRGIHACLGAPLARILLRTEMSVLKQRLPDLRLDDGFDKQYDAVHEGRGIDKLLVLWNAEESQATTDQVPLAAVQAHDAQKALCTVDVVVRSAELIAGRVLHISFVPKTPGQTLPCWTAGANMHVPVGEHGTRQYSLCSDPSDRQTCSIAVLRELDGSGGSEYLHKHIEVGQQLQISPPRNHFKLRPAGEYLFIAGGIGITPIMAMIYDAQARHVPYKLVYLGSSRSEMAFAEELSSDINATVWPKDEFGRFELNKLVDKSRSNPLIYACGPARLMAALESLCIDLPAGTLNVEHFGDGPERTFAPNREFDVLLQRSGRMLRIPKNRTILDMLLENGSSVLSTCTKGTCGTCEVNVLGGEIEHRDTVLTEAEKDQGKSMMVCVSRCHGQRLVLDLW